MSIVEELFPLHRTLVADGTDQALEVLRRSLAGIPYDIENYAPGAPAWTWRVPDRYSVREAYLETQDGERIVDFADSALHLVSYSEPVDRVLSWAELETHLHVAPQRPGAIPWEFRYYERTWGFCLSKHAFDALPRDQMYHAVIASEFGRDPERGLRVGLATVEPDGGADGDGGEFIVCAHICHPRQANDDLSGVASAVAVARALAQRPLLPGSMTVRFLFCPETIGSICFLSHNEELIPRLRGGIFSEMTGNANSLVLQRTRQDSHRLDAVARHVLAMRAPEFREGAFREVIVNDEMVINGPGVDVPCISISRWPYPEYHTSDDTPAIINEERLVEAAHVIEDIIRIYATDYVPRRTFRGPVFLSRYGLWVDWRTHPKLNAALDKIMLRLEGDRSVFDIAAEVDVDYWTVREFVERLRSEGLIEVLPPPPRPSE